MKGMSVVSSLVNLFYAFMLSRATTQAAAFAGTSIRMMVTPLAGMIAQVHEGTI